MRYILRTELRTPYHVTTNFGFWQTDGLPCHLCEPTAVSIRHDCRCEAHRPNEHANLCKEGWPHSGVAGEPCHACQVPADDTYWLHDFLGVPRRAVANAEHPNLAIPTGLRDHRAYPGTCVVEAFATCLRASSEEIWDQLLRTLTTTTLDGAFNEIGLDERAFHALGLIYERTVKLSGIPDGVPNVVGLSRRDILRFHRSRLASGLFHWEAAEIAKTPSATHVRLSKLAPTPSLRALLGDIEAWRGPDGLPLPSQWRDAVTQPARAKQYLRELKNGVVGTIARKQGRTFTKDFLPKLDALHDLARPRRITIMAMSGSPGCGKSAPFKTILSRPCHHVPGLFLGIFPRNSIMRDWSRALHMDRFSWMLNTFELALRRHARVVIVDEVSLLPPGYLDLLLCLRPGISHVVLLGDAVQCRHHAIEEQSELNSITPEVEHWFRGPVPYLHVSHTLPQTIARALDIPSSSPVEGRIETRHHASPNLVTICMTDSETKAARRLVLQRRHTLGMVVPRFLPEADMHSGGLVFLPARSFTFQRRQQLVLVHPHSSDWGRYTLLHTYLRAVGSHFYTWVTTRAL